MKKLLFILVTGIAILSFSCSKQSGNLAPNASQNDPATGSGGTGGPNVPSVSYIWKINSLVVNGTDMTSQFANYKFEIRAPRLMIENGEIIAVNGSTIYRGKWNRTSYNEVTIYFTPPPTLDDPFILGQLNDNWVLTNNQVHDIAMQTNAKMLSFHNDGEPWPSEN